MRRRAAIAAAILAVCLTFITAFAEAAEKAHTVVYFYRNYCESCTPEADFAATFYGLTGVDLKDCDFTGWNVARADGQAALDAAIETLGLESASLPMAVVDGVAYQGANAMNAELSAAALDWRETNDSEILYLYTPACESCARAEAALDALPEAVELHRGDAVVESPVVVRRVDVSADPAYAEALFEAYAVPDERRVTPIAFFGKRYLSGADAIEKSLAAEVALGRAAGGVPEIARAETETGAFSLAGAAGAGLVAGLNACALSMLLLFISLVLESGRRAALPVAAYLGAKLACYLLIGFFLLNLFQSLNPSWLRPLARWVMTAMGAALILVNLSDAAHARRGDLGGVRNQLPAGLRGRLQRAIRALTKAQVLIPAAVALGFIVAGGEFLCAGQLYLMQLLSAVQSGGSRPALMLIVYALAFLTPSAVVSAVILSGHSQARAAMFFSRHLAAVKLLTAAAMLMLIVAAWLMG